MTGLAGLWMPDAIGADLETAFRAAVGDCCVAHPAPSVFLAAGEGAALAEVDEVAAVATADLLLPASDSRRNPMAAVIDAHRRGDPARLDGSFAYACWSPKVGLELAVDLFRTLPLVYAPLRDGVAFSSRIDFLRQIPGVSLAIDLDALVDYLSFTVIPAPRTIFRSIRKLRAGHRLNCHGRVGEPRQYWSVSYRADGGQAREARARDLREHLASSVGRSVESGSGSIGSFLSGGLDSSTVAGLAARSGCCDAFSIGFDEPRYDERQYAQLVARHFGVRHHVRVVTPRDLADSLEQVVRVFDEPFGNSSAVAVYQCARLAKEAGVEVLLAGDGGDELFAGNERYRTDALFQRYLRVPASLRRFLLEPLACSDRFCGVPVIGKVGRYVRRARISNPDRLLSYGLYVDRHLEEVLQPDLLPEVADHRAVETARQLFAEGDADGELGRLLLFDHQITLADNDLRKVTEGCRLAGVTVRYPMLDRRLVEFASRLPSNWLLAGGELRAFYKEAMAGFLPREVLEKRKHGFGLPFAAWLQTDKEIRGQVADLLDSATTPLAQWIRPKFLMGLQKAHLGASEPYYADLLWPFCTLALWLRAKT